VPRAPLDVDAYVAGVLAGERRIVAKTITLLESRRADHVLAGQRVLERLVPHSGRAVRVGISGAPGVGKSSFIEALGLRLVERGNRLAVLAVDPSSPLSGGSILGDKTRMARLAQAPEAYIRPSPSGGTLGGVAHRTREAMLVCEAAGFGIVLVETVGVGQSEAEVDSMVDFFAVLLQPGAGDELQGLKKGVIELADCLIVNKADGEARAQAEKTRADYASALRLLRPRSEHWSPPVLCASALTGAGVLEFWEGVLEHRRRQRESGEQEAKRREQARAWLWRLIREGLEAAFRADPAIVPLLAERERGVSSLATSAPQAARELLERFGRRPGKHRPAPPRGAGH
jgi:LAO/AO transport system kinase